jgi:hypothetical protein
MLIHYVLIFFLSLNSWADSGETKPVAAPGWQQLAWTLGAADTDTTWAELRSSGVAGWFERRHEPFKKIVIYSQDMHLGDSLLESFSILNQVHAKFPHLPIVLVSPLVDLVKTQPTWLTKIKLPMAGVYTDPFVAAAFRKKPQKFLNDPNTVEMLSLCASHINKLMEPGTLFFFNLDGVRSSIFDGVHYRRLHQTITPEWETPAKENIMAFQEALVQRIAVPEGSLRIDFEALFKSTIQPVWTGQKSKVKIRLGANFASLHSIDIQTMTIYESYELFFKMLLGEELAALDRDLFFPSASNTDWQRFLAQQFSEPQKPFVLINLNTFGKHKLAMLSQVQATLFRYFFNFFGAVFPDYNILLVPLETSAAASKEIARRLEIEAEDIASLSNSHLGKMGVLPSQNKTMWVPAMVHADLVLSIDSGFVHAANFNRSPQKTLSFSLDESARTWHAPGQPFTNELVPTSLVLPNVDDLHRPVGINRDYRLDRAQLIQLFMKIESALPSSNSQSHALALAFYERILDEIRDFGSISEQLHIASDILYGNLVWSRCKAFFCSDF